MEEAQEKAMQLLEILAYQRVYQPSFFSAVERMYIHQERAAWLQVARELELSNTAEPKYRVPPVLQKKIDRIAEWLRITNED